MAELRNMFVALYGFLTILVRYQGLGLGLNGEQPQCKEVA